MEEKIKGLKVDFVSDKQLKYYPDGCQILLNCVYNLTVIYHVWITHILVNCFTVIL